MVGKTLFQVLRSYLPKETAAGNLLWAGTKEAGLWLSRDDGATWQAAGLPASTVYQTVVDPNDSHQIIVATERGIFAGAAGQ